MKRTHCMAGRKRHGLHVCAGSPYLPYPRWAVERSPQVDAAQAIGLHQLRNPKPREPHCYGLHCVTPQKPYVEALTPTVTMFGDGAFREVTKIKWGVLIRRERHSNFPLHVRTQEKPWEDPVRRRPSTSQEESYHQKPNLPALWSWTTQPLELLQNKCVLFKPPNVWYFVMAAQTNTHIL